MLKPDLRIAVGDEDAQDIRPRKLRGIAADRGRLDLHHVPRAWRGSASGSVLTRTVLPAASPWGWSFSGRHSGFFTVRYLIASAGITLSSNSSSTISRPSLSNPLCRAATSWSGDVLTVSLNGLASRIPSAVRTRSVGSAMVKRVALGKSA